MFAEIAAALMGFMASIQEPSTQVDTLRPPPPCSNVNSGRVLDTKSLNIPALGEINEAEIGQNMLSSGRLQLVEDVLIIIAPVTFTGRFMANDYELTIPPRESLRPSDRGLGRSYVPARVIYKLNGRERTGIIVPDVSVSVRNDQSAVASLNFGFSTQTRPIAATDIDVRLCTRAGPNAFRQELIYSGVSQGTITIEYREFTNDMARPAFSQTLRYDLNEGREIGFRGARLEILEANNISVRYRVIQPLRQDP